MIIQPNTEAPPDGHFVSLVAVVMASPHADSPGALLYHTAEKVITLLRE